MISGACALLDVEPLRAVTQPTVGVLRLERDAIVLGSTQDVADLDATEVARAGVDVRRRRGGGGAVLLRPLDCWIELWLPAGCCEAATDLRATAYTVGSWWRRALGASGLDAELHRGELRDADQGARACFAGLGPGELTVRGAKLLGLSQWRSREGALVSSIACEGPPLDLARYFASTVGPLPSLARATSLHDVGVRVDQVQSAFLAAARGDLGTLVEAPELFR